MENQQQMQEQNQSKLERMEAMMSLYIDICARGILALLISSGIILLITKFFNISPVNRFIILFLLSIGISPFFPRIRFGHIVVYKYKQFLNKVGIKT